MFFSKKNKLLDLKSATGKEDVVDSNDLFEEEDEENEVAATVTDDDVVTKLSIHPEWHLSQQEQYVYQFHNEDLQPLKPNQVSLSGVMIDKYEGNLIVTAFVRNSLDRGISFNDVPLVLLDKNDKIVASKVFTLDGLGEIPGKSSRPWHFYFEKEDIVSPEFSNEGWKLAFRLQTEVEAHTLDLDDSWKGKLPDDQVEKLAEIVRGLPALGEGEVNFMGLEAKLKENGDLYVTMFIRNGTKKDINIEQIPLVVEDANNQVVAKGGFKLEKFQVKANTTKPWTFIFPSNLVLVKQPDLSRWKAYAPQN